MPDNDTAFHAEAFRAALLPKLTLNLNTIEGFGGGKLNEGYVRLTSLQAWRTFVLEEHLPAGPLGFFSEAQNDGLVSSALISIGMWRPAMKSLRGLIENILHCFYFKDHPIEYRLWDEGKFRPTFKDLFDYFISHPDISSIPENLKGVVELKNHYKHLSNIVHASAREFRMTNEIDGMKLWNTTAEGVGKWAATHKNVLRDVNLLILALHNSYLKGAARKGLREALAIVIPASRDNAVKSSHGVKIVR